MTLCALCPRIFAFSLINAVTKFRCPVHIDGWLDRAAWMTEVSSGGAIADRHTALHISLL